jgi:glycosyltransferase involved in cell wall biosynthesis
MPAKLLHIHKGQKLIFELLAQPKWRGVPLTINLYGEGPDEQEFRTTVKGLKLKCINFHDRVPDLMEIWKYNHAILMPSFMEGLPIVLVGAMLSARVPILTNVGGHREVVEDNKDGFIASLPTVESLDDALERAIANLNDWEEIGLRARQRILDFLPEDPVEDFVQNLSRHMERSYEESSAG